MNNVSFRLVKNWLYKKITSSRLHQDGSNSVLHNLMWWNTYLPSIFQVAYIKSELIESFVQRMEQYYLCDTNKGCRNESVYIQKILATHLK